ncbi:hypothetical protein B0H15DRAFT_766497 [Mycena belliarum]|uniref:Angiogenic factor with G patch and FHA domains 1 n=1 Tax=Mycena belliarum TaxID=1033014 RepID=A0AAD6XUU9_9AGAR|nr:hypothetical protein B0H15DRAFT_766497 [Mycena belliae]
MEAGETRVERDSPPAPADYDPSYEWPGDDAEAGVGPSSRPLLRLLVLRTSVLPAKQTLVVTDGYTEVQIGRDIATSEDVPRVRLKEMEVSKLHSTLYWETAAAGWNIVDMGSKHGTFLQPRSSATAVRLSPPRVASLPRQLHHLDTLAIGGTTFLVHVHAARAPCTECCSTSQNEIPLFRSQKRKAHKASEPDPGYVPAGSRDPRKALTLLKQRLLMPGAPGPVRGEATSYTDRSARRRSLFPSSRLDAPGIAPPQLRTELSTSTPPPPPPPPSWDPPPSVTTSQPPMPLPDTNVGHRLLLAQGWTPGSSLGQNWEEGRAGLTAPLEVASTTRRAGLGMAKTVTGESWQVDGRQRRWQDSQ